MHMYHYSDDCGYHDPAALRHLENIRIFDVRMETSAGILLIETMNVKC